MKLINLTLLLVLLIASCDNYHKNPMSINFINDDNLAGYWKASIDNGNVIIDLGCVSIIPNGENSNYSTQFIFKNSEFKDYPTTKFTKDEDDRSLSYAMFSLLKDDPSGQVKISAIGEKKYLNFRSFRNDLKIWGDYQFFDYRSINNETILLRWLDSSKEGFPKNLTSSGVMSSNSASSKIIEQSIKSNSNDSELWSDEIIYLTRISKGEYFNRQETLMDKGLGQNYAFIIVNDKYNDTKIDQLHSFQTLLKLKNTLKNEYNFSQVEIEPNTFKPIIIDKLTEYKNTLGPNDNLLIVFSGHGHWDPDYGGQGYWWMRNTEYLTKENCLSNKEFLDSIAKINCRHILTIVDACKGGAILKSRTNSEIEKLPEYAFYNRQSRIVISTSAFDQNASTQNLFFDLINAELSKNKNKLLLSHTLFEKVKSRFLYDIKDVDPYYFQNQTPIIGTLNDKNHKQGDFVFIRK